jgi:hypothetical protein
MQRVEAVQIDDQNGQFRQQQQQQCSYSCANWQCWWCDGEKWAAGGEAALSEASWRCTALKTLRQVGGDLDYQSWLHKLSWILNCKILIPKFLLVLTQKILILFQMMTKGE